MYFVLKCLLLMILLSKLCKGGITLTWGSDPCENAINIGNTRRYTSHDTDPNHVSLCDVHRIIEGHWYSFEHIHGDRMSERCTPNYKCGTYNTMHMNGTHPTVDNPGPLNSTICVNNDVNCCSWYATIQVKLCVINGNVTYVYQLKPPSACETAFCVDNVPVSICPTGKTWHDQSQQCIGFTCTADTCKNKGECILDVSGTGYQCNCTTGYTGQNCDIPVVTGCISNQCQQDHCAAANCQNDGTCISTSDGIYCSCLPTFTGKDCSSDTSDKVTDLNNSTNNKSNQTTIIIIMGAVIGALVLVLLVVLAVCKLRNNNKKCESRGSENMNIGPIQQNAYSIAKPQSSQNEILAVAIEEVQYEELKDNVYYEEIKDKVYYENDKNEYDNTVVSSSNQSKADPENVYEYEETDIKKIQNIEESKQYMSLASGPKKESDYQPLDKL